MDKDICPHHYHLEKKIDEVHQAIFGNGQPGIKTKVGVIEESIKSSSKRQQWTNGLLAAVLTTWLGSLAVLIIR